MLKGGDKIRLVVTSTYVFDKNLMHWVEPEPVIRRKYHQPEGRSRWSIVASVHGDIDGLYSGFRIRESRLRSPFLVFRMIKID